MVSALLLSLVPTVGFYLAMKVADQFVEFGNIDNLSGKLGAIPVYLGFISLPSLGPIAAARPGPMRQVATAIMTIVAVVACVLVIATDDAQAGLAVLLVPFTAVPLGLIVLAIRLALDRRERQARIA
jgi:hypothetical protein